MKRARPVAVVGAAVITMAGPAILAGCGTAAKAPAPATAPADPGYLYYRSMMGRFQGGPMMSGPGGYRWMTGGATAPAWMRGRPVPGYLMRPVPGYMMRATHDPGKIMGALWANGPGPRVSPAEAARLGRLVPAGASVDRAANRITFPGASVRLIVLASPASGPDETFRIAGLVNPAVVVRAGARVRIEFVNADPDSAHGLVVSAGHTASSWMPMMTARAVFPGAALWFVGDPTSAGLHAGTLVFTARSQGTYRYLCPVPGHASHGMAGTFIVR